jgi:HPt (histidine-containing phosphotransfer) domain-containing protein
MIGMFVEMTKPLIEQIRTACTTGDAHALVETAHSLKGSARTACCVILGDMAASLQDRGEVPDQCGELVADIEVEFARVAKEVVALSKSIAA